MSKTDTIIVGSGPAGIMAAHTMVEEGQEDFLLLEKDDRIGGRIKSYLENGYSIDLASQLVHPGYKMMYALIEELGLMPGLIQGSMDVLRMYDEKQEKFILTKPIGSDEEKKDTMKWMEKMGGPEKVKEFLDWVESRCADGKMYEANVTWGLDLDDKTLDEYIIENFSKEILEYFVQPIVSAVSLTWPERISAIYGLQILWTVLVGNVAVMETGLEAVILKLQEEIGERARTNCEVEEILITDGKATGVRLANGDIIEANNVICATESHNAYQIIPDLPQIWRDALKRTRYSKVMTTLTLVDRPLGTQDFSGAIFPRKSGYPFTAVSFKSVRAPKSVPEGKDCITVFVYDHVADKYWARGDSEVRDMVVGTMEEMFDFFDASMVEDFVVERFIRGNYLSPAGIAQEFQDLRENNYFDIENLFMAGDYLYLASYEAAMHTGRQAVYIMLGKEKIMK